MSTSADLPIGILALPLILVVLAVAGVRHPIRQGGKLFEGHSLRELETSLFRGELSASEVRTLVRNSLMASEATLDGGALAWEQPDCLFGSKHAEERLQSKAEAFRRSCMQVLGVETLSQGSEGAQSHHRAAETICRARAAAQLLESELPLRLVAEQCYSDRLLAARSDLDAAEALFGKGKPTAALERASGAEALLATTVHESYERLVRAERAVIVAAVGNTLEDLGYQIKVATGKGGVALVGRREHNTIAMAVRADGRLEMDTAGFEGDSCASEARALLDGFARNGLVIPAVDLTPHGRFDGGPMIRAAQRSGKPLEIALAEMAPTAGAGQGPEAGPVRRKIELASADEERLRKARAFLFGRGFHKEGTR